MSLAFKDDGHLYEIIHGKIYNMAQPHSGHIITGGNVSSIFRNFLKGKKCKVFPDGMRLVLKNEDVNLRPDVMIVCNRDIIKDNGIHGVPDLIVEVLSPSTAKNDRNFKKNLYEKIGVKEYWLISPVEKFIEVYLLKDGKYELDNIYYHEISQWMLDDMSEEELAEVKREFKISLEGFDDLIIDVDDVFDDIDI